MKGYTTITSAIQLFTINVNFHSSSITNRYNIRGASGRFTSRSVGNSRSSSLDNTSQDGEAYENESQTMTSIGLSKSPSLRENNPLQSSKIVRSHNETTPIKVRVSDHFSQWVLSLDHEFLARNNHIKLMVIYKFLI